MLTLTNTMSHLKELFCISDLSNTYTICLRTAFDSLLFVLKMDLICSTTATSCGGNVELNSLFALN